jgi:hypothetical protein
MTRATHMTLPSKATGSQRRTCWACGKRRLTHTLYGHNICGPCTAEVVAIDSPLGRVQDREATS